MIAAPQPDREFERLMALARYDILDTLPEERFDRLTELTAEVLQVPVAVINFVDQFRHWGKACVGVPDFEAPREQSVCAWTILQGEVMVVPELRRDPRFEDHPLVQGGDLHFYAGAPLVTPEGHRVGTLCVTDQRPHPFGPREERLLAQFAALVVEALELRVRERELEREVEARAAQVEDLRRTAAHAETLSAITALFDSGLDPQEATRASAELLSVAADVDWAGLLASQAGGPQVLAEWDRRHPGAQLLTRDLSAYRGGVSGLSTGSQHNTFINDYPAHPRAIPAFVAQGVSAVALLALGKHGEVQYALLVARTGREQHWRRSDRALLEASARSVRGALERASQLQRAQAAALSDGLTGLGNRRAFDAALSDLEASARPFAAVVVDLDGMKAVNDREGHERGDALLTLFGQALRAQFRGGDGVYRLGGDEFAVLLSGERPLDEGDVLERIHLAVLAVRSAGFGAVDASAGVAERVGRPALDVVQDADQRMYEQKRHKARPRSPV